MEKGDILQIRIEDVTEDGQGLGRAEDGRMVFIRRGEAGAVPLPGDLVRCEVTKLKKRYAQAELMFLDTASSLRTEEKYCPHQKSCGGCALGGLSYEEQLKLKRRHLQDAVQRIGGLKDVIVRPAVGMGEDAADGALHYRSKAVFTVSEENGKPVVGFYQSRTHRAADCPECRIQSPAALACAEALKAFMESDHVQAFSPRTGKGLLKNMIVRTAFGTGEVMVILVINGKGIPNGEKLVGMLDDAIYNLGEDPGYALTSVWVNQNRGKNHDLYGKNSVCLAGERVIHEGIGGMKFEITPEAFYQVNPYMMEKLYDQVREYADLKEGDRVLDLYCGAGTIGLWLSSRMQDKIELVGIESNHEAVVAANRNAVINGIVHARYVTGKAEEEIGKVLGQKETEEHSDAPHLPGTKNNAQEKTSPEDLLRIHLDGADCVILDPPRAGCDQSLLQACADAAPEKIVYVSCEPPTLARDLSFLAECGYRAVEMTPFDMFPQTGRLEAAVLLERE
ncbi:MAG: 23S rRNA (uracil(1939)-C(5))-methyltransferase RlmD [Eubacterium sp.]|jgi:23S rRNA (uracil1939-C5)-methyltransferase|nr:23S rRNA (uracil(1939)-C(5))-methyltransferase RlmD [Eubacterium sp.]MCH4046648.1 23S rRNA (uracil(1939)-C(5))-methyltransferase RlmD [Eubacterium sp.]MCH4079744.1 23S rRNA (uracil(1939)-C(5))-methyltransferase RlmD [Eubacterium sp.]MCH4110304.1 23S rRNA (uracil(1939)-C(5))-methyltransferase RlmD [Eubacterium sp.]MCI1307083.1 23S rRNA (uracil(1939)-C(5))-methyltransferase RlmD [Eubacterium sp.]